MYVFVIMLTSLLQKLVLFRLIVTAYFILHSVIGGDWLCRFNIQSRLLKSYDVIVIGNNVILNALQNF